MTSQLDQTMQGVAQCKLTELQGDERFQYDCERYDKDRLVSRDVVVRAIRLILLVGSTFISLSIIAAVGVYLSGALS